MGPRRLFDDIEPDWERLCGPGCPGPSEAPEASEQPDGLSLLSFTPEHLGSVPSLLALHRDAVARGLLPDSEDGLLGFLATAEGCLRRGRNPAALFRWLIEAGRFDRAAFQDEDVAHAAFKRYRRSRHPTFLKTKPNNPSVGPVAPHPSCEEAV